MTAFTRAGATDALVLTVEEHPDAIVNIATLTRACLRALGDQIAGVFNNHQRFVGQATTAARHTDESVWQLPLDQRYRKQIDSPIADLKNMGGEHPGAITAALFLAAFDGVGTRLLVDLALQFTPPAS